MGVLEDLETRVTSMENRWDEHDTVHTRIDRKLDLLIARTGDLIGRTDDLGEIRARVAVIPELQAGQIEMREMLATLLARTEQGRGR